ncbi:hypothetical protein J3F84DRAFT_391368 [Trichoderma pleuroticola]
MNCTDMGFAIDMYQEGIHKINMMAAEEVASPRPRRPPVVCDQCRIRKLKCDRKFPCNRCLKSVDKRVCTYKKAPHPRDLPVSPTESPVPRQPVAIAPPEISQGPNPGREQNVNPEYPQSQHVVLDQNKASELFPSWCYHGQGSWQSLLRKMDGFYDYVHQAIVSKQSTLQAHNDIVNELTRVSRQDVLPLRGAERTYLCSLIPQHETTTELIQKYEKFWEAKFRIIYMPTFWKEYHRLRQDPSTTALEYPAKLLLVLLLGYQLQHDGEDTPSSEIGILSRHTALLWLQAVESWLFTHLEVIKPTLGLIQILCLLALPTRPYTTNTWHSYATAGYLMKLAIMIGLHMDSGNLAHISATETELRRRLWATIMEIEISNSLDRGLMPMFTLEMFDTLAPANLNDQDLEEGCSSTAANLPSDCWFQITLLQSLPLRLEVCQVLTNRKCDLTYQKVLDLDTELNKALSHLHSTSEDIAPMIPSLLLDRWRARTTILDLHIRRCLLAVHQAFVVYPKDQKMFHYPRIACLDSASVFLSAQDTLVHEELASSLLLSTHLHAFILTCFLLMQHALPESFASQGSLSYMCTSWIHTLLEKSRDASSKNISTYKRGLKEYTIQCFLLPYSICRRSSTPYLGLMEAASKRYGDVCSTFSHSLQPTSSPNDAALSSPTLVDCEPRFVSDFLQDLPSVPMLHENISWNTPTSVGSNEYLPGIDMSIEDFLLGVLDEHDDTTRLYDYASHA